jgi:hypothetical protein
MTLFAEAAKNPAFAKHRLIFDQPERGADMDVEKYFGSKVAARLEPPRGKVNSPEYSTSVRELFYNLDDALDKGPCIYVIDSVDGIGIEEDDEKFYEEKAAWEKDKEVAGSYGTAKAKYISKHAHRIVQRLDEHGSIFVAISQTRDRIGTPGKTRSGGRALKFYAHLEVWFAVKGPITKTVLGREREIGSIIQPDIQKNRFTGWEGKTHLLSFYRTSGFDSTGAMIDFLTSESFWECEGKTLETQKITAPEFTGYKTVKRDALIQHIEESGKEEDLTRLVCELWAKIEAGCAVVRKPRYE